MLRVPRVTTGARAGLRARHAVTLGRTGAGAGGADASRARGLDAARDVDVMLEERGTADLPDDVARAAGDGAGGGTGEAGVCARCTVSLLMSSLRYSANSRMESSDSSSALTMRPESIAATAACSLLLYVVADSLVEGGVTGVDETACATAMRRSRSSGSRRSSSATRREVTSSESN